MSPCTLLRFPATVFLTGFLFSPSLVHASLLGTQLTASLISTSDQVNASDSVTVGPGVELKAGDGSNIGRFLFTSTSPNSVDVPEYVDFSATGVELRIAGADPSGNGKTGYGTGAKYVFSGLHDDKERIVGLSAIALSTNISIFSVKPDEVAGCTSGICFDPAGSSLTVFLDQLTIGQDGNLPAPMGLVTITFKTIPIPLPASLPMLLAGLAGLGWLRRPAAAVKV